jgi:hypothetical protein
MNKLYLMLLSIVLLICSVYENNYCLATSVTFGNPNPSGILAPSDVVTVPILTDNILISLDAVISLNGPASIISATGIEDAGMFGWDLDLSADPIITSSSAEVGLGSFMGTATGVVAEVVIQCDGPGYVTVTLLPGFTFGSSSDINLETPTVSDSLVIHQEWVGEQVTLDVRKVVIKASNDRSEPQDNIIITGQLAEALSAFDPNDDVIVRVSASGTDYISETIAHDNPSLKISAKRNVLTYSGSTGALTQLKISQANGAFLLSAKKIDLSGLNGEVTVEVRIGDQLISGSADEDVINGSKSAPIKLLSGNTDTLRISKARVTKNADKLLVSGEITVEEMIDSEQTTIEITASWGGKSFVFECARKKAGKNLFLAKKVELNDDSVVTAGFDFDKCGYKIFVKNSSDLADSGEVTLAVQFGDFNQTAVYDFD